MAIANDLKYKGLRSKLVEQLKNKGIDDESVLGAINTVQRHLFVEDFLREKAYYDIALPIASGQTISQPYTVAFQTQLIDISKGMKVLEVGTGSGYQTAVLIEMGAKVFSIERHAPLFKRTSTLLNKLGYRPMLFLGDGYKGKPTYGPFDRIIITAAASYIPKSLIMQLKTGGKMVLPLGNENTQKMTVIDKQSNNHLTKSTYGSFAFVPMLHGIAK